MRKSFALLLLAVSQSCFGGEGGYRLIHRVFGIEAEKLEAAKEANSGVFGDDDEFVIPAIPSWSVAVLRLKK